MAQAQPTPTTAASGTAHRGGTALSRFRHIASRFIVPATTTKCSGLRLAFDIEANGLLPDATTVHCVIVSDLDSNQIDQYEPNRIPAALAHLSRAAYLAGHNITDYDLPLLRKLYDWAPAPDCTLVDTLVAGRLILPNLKELDDMAAAMGDQPLGKLHGRHSIEAWGARLCIPKVGADIDDWSKWTPEMQARCVGDVAICKALWKFIAPDDYAQKALELEHRTSVICNQITADGVPFDVEASKRLYQRWTARRDDLTAQLQHQFPGTNLNSRVQIGALLQARGWVPEKRTKKTNQAKIDDEILEKLPAIFPEFAGLAEHQILGRRLGQLSNGKEAWLKHIGKDGRIHGAVVHIGTPHSRAAHFNPNLAQVPNPKRGKPLATECRALFHHPGDWVFVACDQAGLQDRCFSHYLAEIDGGAYGRSFIAGADTHWASAIALELIPPNTERDKTSRLHVALREGSKSFRYGFLFGMRGKRAGEIVATIIRAARAVDPSYKGPTTNGAQALHRFEAATPGLKQLRESLEAQAARNAWVLGLDGRRVPTGAQYKALNRIVTSAEAIVCKRWLINVHDELCTRFRYGWSGDVVITAWIHDELVACCRPEVAKEVGEIMVRYAKEAGEFYSLKIPLDAEYTVGRNWAGETIDAQPTAQTYHDEINDGLKREGIAPINWEALQGVSDARCVVGDARRKTNTGVSHGNGPHHQVHCEDPARLAVASEVSRTPGNGIDPAPNQRTDLERQTAAASASSYTHRTHGDNGPKQGRSIATWIYAHPNQPNYLRVDKHISASGERRFYQHHWNGSKWVYGVKNTYAETKIPYRLPELLTAAPDTPIFVCEGEKDTDNVAALGLIATTNPGGAKVFQPELAQWFKGKELVYILEDNDEAGRGHTGKILAALAGIVPTIAVVAFPELAEKGDVSDWLAQGGNKNLLLARAEQARNHNKTQEIIEPIDLWGRFDPPVLPQGLLPETIERFAIEEAELMGVDLGGLAMAALAVCAAALPDHTQLQVKRHDPNWLEAARLWVGLIGNPSTKKTPVILRATKPLKRIDTELWRSYVITTECYEQLSKEERKTVERPKQRRLRLEDTTIEAAQEVLKDSPDGVLCIQDELAGWFGAMDKYAGRGAAKDRGFWLQSFHGGPYALNRIARGAAMIENLSVSLLGGIQPDPIRKIAAETVDDGLLQRLIPIVLRRGSAGQDTPHGGQDYDELITRLHDRPPPSGPLQFTDAALTIRQELEQKHLDLMAYEIINRKLAAHIGKYDGLFARFCLLWHCIEGAEGSAVSEHTARRVADFMRRFLLPHATAFYADMLELSDDHDRLTRVAGYILARKLSHITNRDVQRGSRAMRGLQRLEIESIFEQLEALGWLIRAPGPYRATPLHWQVNPVVHRRFAERAEREAKERTKEREMLQEMFRGGKQ